MKDTMPESNALPSYAKKEYTVTVGRSYQEIARDLTADLTTARQCIMDLAAALHKMCEHNSPGIVYGQDALVHHAKTIEGCK